MYISIVTNIKHPSSQSWSKQWLPLTSQTDAYEKLICAPQLLCVSDIFGQSLNMTQGRVWLCYALGVCWRGYCLQLKRLDKIEIWQDLRKKSAIGADDHTVCARWLWILWSQLEVYQYVMGRVKQGSRLWEHDCNNREWQDQELHCGAAEWTERSAPTPWSQTGLSSSTPTKSAPPPEGASSTPQGVFNPVFNIMYTAVSSGPAMWTALSEQRSGCAHCYRETPKW